MNDDHLRQVTVHHTDVEHRQRLRQMLLAHAQEVQTVKKTAKYRNPLRHILPIGIAATLGLAIVVGMALLPRSNTSKQSAPNSVARLKGALTPSQVFAAAADYADGQKANKGKYFYQKAREQNSFMYCVPNHEYIEVWTDQDGSVIRERRSNTKGKTIEDFYPNSPEKHYFDQSAVEFNVPDTKTEQPTADELAQLNAMWNSCPQRQPLTEEEQAKWSEHAAALARAFGFNGTAEKPVEAGGSVFMNNLRQGDIMLQAETFRKLQTVGGWTVTNDVTNADFSNNKLVKLSFSYGWAFENLYFDQQTAAFVGFESEEMLTHYNNYVVVDQKRVDSLK